MKEIIKKYKQKIIYVIFVLMSLLYARIILSLCRGIEAAKTGGFVKLFEENLPIWYYESEEKMILHEKILICFFILTYCLSVGFIKRKLNLFLFFLFLPLIFMFCEYVYENYVISSIRGQIS